MIFKLCLDTWITISTRLPFRLCTCWPVHSCCFAIENLQVQATPARPSSAAPRLNSRLATAAAAVATAKPASAAVPTLNLSSSSLQRRPSTATAGSSSRGGLVPPPAAAANGNAKKSASAAASSSSARGGKALGANVPNSARSSAKSLTEWTQVCALWFAHFSFGMFPTKVSGRH
jgi:hypothetical protein